MFGFAYNCLGGGLFRGGVFFGRLGYVCSMYFFLGVCVSVL